MTDNSPAALIARLQRLEALDEIRQLAAKYAVALDMRDLDSLVNLFVDDVAVPGHDHGRPALRRWYDRELRHGLLGSAHGVHGHVIDVHDTTTRPAWCTPETTSDVLGLGDRTAGLPRHV